MLDDVKPHPGGTTGVLATDVFTAIAATLRCRAPSGCATAHDRLAGVVHAALASSPRSRLTSMSSSGALRS